MTHLAAVSVKHYHFVAVLFGGHYSVKGFDSGGNAGVVGSHECTVLKCCRQFQCHNLGFLVDGSCQGSFSHFLIGFGNLAVLIFHYCKEIAVRIFCKIEVCYTEFRWRYSEPYSVFACHEVCSCSCFHRSKAKFY